MRDAAQRPAALELFAHWLRRRENAEDIAFESLLESHPELARELTELHSAWKELLAAGELSESRAGPGHAPTPHTTAALVARLAQRGIAFDRYSLHGEVARGGMGSILRVWDEDLRRQLAMKVALDDRARTDGAQRLARFLEEARITGRLDHPGIVPVHELGLDFAGRVYFTMKLVEGRDLRQVFELVFAGREGWSTTRGLGVLQKVCEAMAYAHANGVIHRDLKPANVMVGGFGEVYVMDWGLARVLQRADGRDLRIAPDDDGDRRGTEAGTDLVTLDGAVLGTPVYMPPEQARGEIDALSPRSDVYSIGAMLYHLLARRMPYIELGARVPAREVLARVRAGPPRSLHEIDAQIPAELVAICEKAMARAPERRYGDTLAFAEDLRAYLEGRVVAAYETGALAELRKWVSRNKALAAACGAALVCLVAGLVVSSSLFVQARAARLTAEQRADDVLSLSAGRELEQLVVRADELWPVRPELAPIYEAWLSDARALIDGRPGNEALGVRAKPGLLDHRRKLALLEARALPRDGSVPLQFASGEDAWWHGQLSKLISALTAFADPERGLCSAGVDPEHGWGVEKRLAFARSLREESVSGALASARWQAAIGYIRDRSECPAYDGLELEPQLGLLPLGLDPLSGLWEFAHLPSGGPADPDAAGGFVMREGAGVVLVLVPGGTFEMGAQWTDPLGANFDPMATLAEGPVHAVTLAPFFISKFEMTQDQWVRFAGSNPSAYGLGTGEVGRATTLLHPVENVTPKVSLEVLGRMGLTLPTEAQWERAARGGTSTSWWTGAEKESLAGAANIGDARFGDARGDPHSIYEDWLDDGFVKHAPVGSFRANPFGLHDVAGNLYELCRDGNGTYASPTRAGDGLRENAHLRSSMIRGGSYFTSRLTARSAHRRDVMLVHRDFATGIRPARAIDP